MDRVLNALEVWQGPRAGRADQADGAWGGWVTRGLRPGGVGDRPGVAVQCPLGLSMCQVLRSSPPFPPRTPETATILTPTSKGETEAQRGEASGCRRRSRGGPAGMQTQPQFPLPSPYLHRLWELVP